MNDEERRGRELREEHLERREREERIAQHRKGVLSAQRHLAEIGRYAAGDVVGLLRAINGDVIGMLPGTVKVVRESRIGVEAIFVLAPGVIDEPVRQWIRHNLEVDAEGYGAEVFPLHDLKPDDLDSILGTLQWRRFKKLARDDPEVLEAVAIEIERLRPEGSRLHV